jgi:putative restriction endonuclease
MWSQLPTAIPPKTILRQIVPLLPDDYSPLRAVTGDGNQKIYFAEVGEPLVSLIVGLGGLTVEEVRLVAPNAPDAIRRLCDATQQSIETDPFLTPTEKEQLVLARRGQGLFRSRVMQLESKCRLTGIRNPVLLLASHIKPWRACSTAAERLDGENGLMLTPHVDRLFDRGLLSFTNSGDVLLSPKLERGDINRLGLEQACSHCTGPFTEGQGRYLQHHREVVFQNIC